MSQNLTANSIRQMPQVTSPDLLHMKIIDKLIANCLDQTANLFALHGQWISNLFLVPSARGHFFVSIGLKNLYTAVFVRRYI